MMRNPPIPQPLDFIAQMTQVDLRAGVPMLPLPALIDGTRWLRIGAIARTWEAADAQSAGDPLASVLAALYHVSLGVTPGAPTFGIAWLLASNGIELGLWAGERAPAPGASRPAGAAPQRLEHLLRGAYPGIELAADTTVGARVRPLLAFQGRLCGVPAGAEPSPAQPGEGARGQGRQGQGTRTPPAAPGQVRIERVIRGLRGQGWAWLVCADAIPEQQLDADRTSMLEHVRAYSVNVGTSGQVAATASATLQGGAPSLALEIAQRMVDRLDTGLAQGCWQVTSAFCAADGTTLESVAALLQAAFSGPDGGPQRLRALPATARVSNLPTAPNVPNFPGAAPPLVTSLTTPELAALLRPPRVESQGYALRPWVTFDLAMDAAPASAGQPLPLGTVMDQQTQTGLTFTVPREMLARHGLLAGVTRSGKTTTAQVLLRELRTCSPPVPFLVIEPAKREYRDLLAQEDPDEPDPLLVLTPGDEDQAPFRLNPFEFPAGAARDGVLAGGVHVQQHLDYLKAAFNAAFAMYPPVPFVLERCLVEVYRDAGWDLVSGANTRHAADGAVPAAAFPTLTDLHLKLSEVVEQLRYDERIRRDVLGALDTRIGSLRLGTKGTMLDTRTSLDMGDLLSRPVVVELERLADDEEKAFLMSLLLVRLAEQRMIEASRDAEEGTRANLRHVTLIEEAHRLLAQTSVASGPEGPATRAKAVETFASLLSELGGLGEGVLVAEQIPSKLVPDVIKNSGLKVAHRTVAGDDRQLLGGAMVMTPEQERALATLRTGEAIVFADGMDAPMLIARGAPREPRPRATVRHVQRAWSAYRGKQPRAVDIALGMPGACPVPGVCKGWKTVPTMHEKGACSAMRQQVSGLEAEAEALAIEFDRALLALLVDRAHAPERTGALRALCQRRVQAAGAGGFPLQCLLAHGMHAALGRRARQYLWPYDLLAQVASALIALLGRSGPQAADLAPGTALTRQLDAALAHETALRGPFPGCAECPTQARCHYRYATRPLMTNALLIGILKPLEEHLGDPDVAGEQMRRTVKRAAQPLGLSGGDAAGHANYCLAAQAVEACGQSPDDQLLMLHLMWMPSAVHHGS